MTLPDPPMISHYLLEEPWPLVIVLAGVGLMLVYHAGRVQRRGIMVAGASALLLAGGVLALAWLVTTTRETLIARTGELVDATAPLDSARLRAFFAPTAVLSGPDGSVWMPLSQVLAEADRANQRFTFRGQGVREIRAEEQAADTGQTELDLRTVLGSEFGDYPITTRWLLTWNRQPDGVWRVTNIRWLQFRDAPPRPGIWR